MTTIITSTLIALGKTNFPKNSRKDNQLRTHHLTDWLPGGCAIVEPSVCKQNSHKKTVDGVITIGLSIKITNI